MGVQDRVARHQQALAPVRDDEGGVARRMPRGRHHRDARRYLRLALDHRRALGNGLQRALGANDEGLHGFGHLVHAPLGHPPVVLARLNRVSGLGVAQLVEVVDQAPDVVGMGVGQRHQRHVLQRVARRLEVGGQPAGRGLEPLAGADIDQHRLVPGLDEDVVGVAVVRLGREEPFGQERLQLLLRHVRRDAAGGDGEVAVAQDRHADAADLRAEDAGHLLAGGLERRRWGRGGGGEGAERPASGHAHCAMVPSPSAARKARAQRRPASRSPAPFRWQPSQR